MASQNLGRVGLVLKGTWSSTTQYEKLDVVAYDGNSWAAKRSNKNVTPNTTNTDDWQLMANNADVVSTVQGYKNDAETAAGNASASASAAASSAAEASDALASIAPAYSDLTFPVSAGTFCWYSGALYAANQDIPTSEAWTAAHWRTAVIGNEVSGFSSELGDRINAIHGLVNYGYDTPYSGSGVSGSVSVVRNGTTITINTNELSPNSTTIKVAFSNNVVKFTNASASNLNAPIKLTVGHLYRVWMIVMGGTATNTVSPVVYINQIATSVGTVVNVSSTLMYRDFLYTSDLDENGVNISIAIFRTTTGNKLTNYKFVLLLEDITHNAQIITDGNINYALRDSATLSSDFSTGKFFDLSGNIGSVVNVLGTSADFCRQKVACHAGDTFVLTAQTDSTTGANVWAFTDTDNKLLKKAADGANASGLTMIADQDGYLLVNALVNETHTLTASLLYKAVSDVQVNGTSVVSGGVANVPVADSSTLGVISIGTGTFGVKLDSSNQLVTVPATAENIKIVNNSYRPITPSVQHNAAFYGLAKAAGDTTQSSSSNAVGVYTETAKDKILTMLGVLDLIAPHETTGTASQAYAQGECFIYQAKLYRATSAIAIADAITPGTNCEQTTLMAEILQ